MDVVDQIADVATGNVGPYQDVPLEVITIESVTLVNEAALISDIHLSDDTPHLTNAFKIS